VPLTRLPDDIKGREVRDGLRTSTAMEPIAGVRGGDDCLSRSLATITPAVRNAGYAQFTVAPPEPNADRVTLTGILTVSPQVG
jgi:hypothetical protein